MLACVFGVNLCVCVCVCIGEYVLRVSALSPANQERVFGVRLPYIHNAPFNVAVMLAVRNTCVEQASIALELNRFVRLVFKSGGIYSTFDRILWENNDQSSLSAISENSVLRTAN